MISHAIGRRCYSTPKAASKLWVKHNRSPSIKVSIKSCIDIDDFAKKVKQELNTNSQVALFTSLDNEPIRPWLKIKELMKTEFKNNSGETPLLVKIIPATQHSIPTKTIYIGETDEDGKFMGEYKRRTLRNDHDLMKVIKPEAQGLIHPSSPDDVLLSFDDIKDGEKYHLYKFAQNIQSWQKKAETLLDLSYGETSIDLPTDIYDSTAEQIRDWDGILFSGDTLYLLEAKHSMSIEKLKKIADRVKQMKLSAEKLFDVKDRKIVGIACGTRFPSGCREEAHRLAFMILPRSLMFTFRLSAYETTGVSKASLMFLVVLFGGVDATSIRVGDSLREPDIPVHILCRPFRYVMFVKESEPPPVDYCITLLKRNRYKMKLNSFNQK